MTGEFQAECDQENKVTTFTEFSRERRLVGSDRAALAGEFKTIMEYTFRCTTCGLRTDKLLDTAGVLHKWQGNRHVMMKV